ncbi:unnamed protein product [Urochloa humidicola]
MAVGGGVRVASSVELWGRRGRSSSGSRAASTVRCSYVGEAGPSAHGGLAEEHYRTLRLRPGATRGEVKKAFRRLALVYHPDVCKESDGGDRDCGVQFRRINVAYQKHLDADADEQHEGGRGAARVLAAQVRPQRQGSRQVQVLPQRRRLVGRVKRN